MIDKLFKIKFPRLNAKFTEKNFAFSIQNIKSRYPSVVYFKLLLYDMSENLLGEYYSERKVVSSKYHTIVMNLTTTEVALSTTYFELELIFDGLDDDNTCSFNGLMFQEGEYSDYHRPDELTLNLPIKFIKNKYINLYNEDGYLQVIRPDMDTIHTGLLDKSKCTVIAPHFLDDDDVDDDASVFFEFANQREQRIDILK